MHGGLITECGLRMLGGLIGQVSVSVPDKYGYLALHIAASNHASDRVLSELIAEFPDATKAKDNRGNTPLQVCGGM